MLLGSPYCLPVILISDILGIVSVIIFTSNLLKLGTNISDEDRKRYIRNMIICGIIIVLSGSVGCICGFSAVSIR